jgi:signal peptidase I
VKAEVEEKSAETANRMPEKAGDRVWQEIVSWFWVIMVFLVIEGALVQARVIPSGSMEDTVLIGDHLIVSRIGYDVGIPFTNWHIPLWRNPKRQQIIVFRAPLPEQGYPDFIKRTIGIPGDHIKIAGGKVFVNGTALVEPYALHNPDFTDTPVENYPPTNTNVLDGRLRPQWQEELPTHIVNGELVVPPGMYFMMGDNRDNSNDGRFWGFVPRENIIGTPVIIYMSIDAPEEVWDPGHIGDRFATYLKVFIHPGEVRWKRLFRTF